MTNEWLRRTNGPKQTRRHLLLPLIWIIISGVSAAVVLGKIYAEESHHTSYIAYSVAEGMLTEAIGPKLWNVKNEAIRIAPYGAAHFRTYPEPLEPYFIQSSVFVPDKGVLPWSCKIYYYLDESKLYDTWHVSWIKVNGVKVLNNGDPCSGEPCPKW